MPRKDHAVTQEDRRQHPRVDAHVEGSLVGSAETGCRVVNISRSGALAITSSPLPEFSQVRIHLQVRVPDHEPVSIDGDAAVVRCDRRADGRFDVGLFFTGWGAAEQAVIEKLCESGALLSVR